MQAHWQDLRYGLRMLLKTPGFSAVAVLTLALGIGANTTIFGFVNALLVRPLGGVSDPATLVQLLRAEGDSVSDNLSYRDCHDYREQSATLVGIALYRHTPLHLSTGQETERITGAMVSGDYFPLLAVKAQLGRLLTSADTQAEGASPIVVLSHSLWSNRFGADPRIVGKTVSLNGGGYTVIGVAMDGFTGLVTGDPADVWIPITMWRQADPQLASLTASWNVDWFGERDATWLNAFGRLKPGVTIGQAQTELSSIAQRLAQAYPQTNQKVGVRLGPGLGLSPYTRGRVSQFVKLPLIIVGIVLLIACANVAGMMLAKASARRKEIGIRLALGATRWRIARQLLMESLLMALAGGLLGFFFALWLSSWLRVSVLETYLNLPLKLNLAPDARVFSFTLAVSVLTGVLFGLVPAWHSSRLDLIPVLKDQHSLGRPARRIRSRDALVVTQVALSLVLLITAGLCLRTLRNARAIDTGFDTQRVLTARIDLGRQNYTEAQGRIFYRRLTERMEAVPGVQAASLALNVPLSGLQAATRIHPEGRPPEAGRMQISFNYVTPRYLETVGIRLLAGRRFSAQDDQQSPRVAIVNETLARRYWPNEDPIGKRFRFGDSNPGNPLIEIVGVAGDTKVANPFALPRMYFYLPMEQHYQNQAVLHLRTNGAPEQLIPTLQREIAALDRSLPVYDIKTLTSYLDDALTPQRLAAHLLSGFGALAMILAAIGLYGRMAYDVERRTREVGIRMALGAQMRDVLLLIVKQGMSLTLIGVVIGLIAAFATTRLIEGLLFGVSATDPLTFAIIPVPLIGAAALACYIPARRAMKVDPIKSLRQE